MDILESLDKGKPIVGAKYSLSVFSGTELGVDVVWPRLMPARRFLPKNEGSSKARAVCFSILLVDRSSLTVWPLPRKFLSFILNVAIKDFFYRTFLGFQERSGKL